MHSRTTTVMIRCALKDGLYSHGFKSSFTPFYNHQSYTTSKGSHKPGPLPLGNKEQQAEYEALVREAETRSRLNTDEKHPDAERHPLPRFPNNCNPVTGEVGGPKGVEPTRYGDWERKGRVFDF
ncbi:hypothetical protein BATDEDRAFT_92333 [Batrachochytrium dendrobatidis JAM81]|uniref:Succinate dehydrogenase assembly factor 4, mitochondrial n=2 Tax=Batrachochytrium dendrobatidis TaxID=109871 RepID=F4PDC4_BATDJ|nr:uncharacterized protein BATDEDRAFT_92333 [Batrachochytrium dendrobatidis JAM81]EGF76765.1 hypothetical protein BATDEDRAFT_92333 [Batrachochytrium dendrobatidis JAM81]KAJ8329185.1 hypothetical protein O5D80_002609 [Batrachochytrium dendrobatidis]KAK5670043.1 hypothetical protein QVD99_003478 [Batrachochytrium dendrobatidis]|eukprot:XP_006682716.1 hypothetical protein BATDEDRAFT_92333 [Batrachochytrium dendrobatidis JAM81]